jgi:hypothetical protein
VNYSSRLAHNSHHTTTITIMSSQLKDTSDGDNHKIFKCVTSAAEESSYASTASISPFNGSLGISPVNNEELSYEEGVETVITTGLARIRMFDDDRENYMIAPSTKEAKENERYARKVGICL